MQGKQNFLRVPDADQAIPKSMERSLLSSGRHSRIGILQDENDEFINFSDDENVVTLPLDIISNSSRNSSRNCDELTNDIANAEKEMSTCTSSTDRHTEDIDDNNIDDKADTSDLTNENFHDDNDDANDDIQNIKNIIATDKEYDKATMLCDDNTCKITDASDTNSDGTKHSPDDTPTEPSDRGDDYSDDLTSYVSEEEVGVDCERSEPSPTPTESVNVELIDTDVHETDQDKPIENGGSKSGQSEEAEITLIEDPHETSTESESKAHRQAKVLSQDELDANGLEKWHYVPTNTTHPITVEITPKLDKPSLNSSTKHNVGKVQTDVSSRSAKSSDCYTERAHSNTRHSQHKTVRKLYAQQPKPLQTYSAKHKLLVKRKMQNQTSSQKVHRDPNVADRECNSASIAGHKSFEQNEPKKQTDLNERVQQKQAKYVSHQLLTKRRSTKEQELQRIYHSKSNKHTKPIPHRQDERRVCAELVWCAYSPSSHSDQRQPTYTKEDSNYHRVIHVSSIDKKIDPNGRKPRHTDEDGVTFARHHTRSSDKSPARLSPASSRKMTKPLNINDLHQEISAINAKAMADHQKHFKANEVAIVYIENIDLKPGNRNEQIKAPDPQYKRRTRSPKNSPNKANINKKVTYSRESLNKFASQHNENKLKIEPENRYAQSLSSDSVHRNSDSNTIKVMSESSLLREDYTSGNWNINERYGNGQLSTKNNKPSSSGSNTDLLPSDEINIITDTHTDAPAQETRITLHPRPYKLAPLPLTVGSSRKHGGKSKDKTARSVKHGRHGTRNVTVSEAM